MEHSVYTWDFGYRGSGIVEDARRSSNYITEQFKTIGI